MLPIGLPIPVQRLDDPLLQEFDVSLYVLRADLLHPHISGNKWFKLKYNLQQAVAEQHHTLLTFGGAFSNHIAATAAAGKETGFNTIGIIRGEKTTPLNPTLSFANECGMQLHYVSRTNYREKHTDAFSRELEKRFGRFYLIPEGGANDLGIKGCSEILNQVELAFDYICCACGTGTTLAGMIPSLTTHQHAIGFSSLKGSFMEQEVMAKVGNNKNNWHINPDFHFGGYAKTTPELVHFVKSFLERNGIPLDYIYTGKMMFGIYELIKKNFFRKNATVLALHSGGLQGNKGYKEVFN